MKNIVIFAGTTEGRKLSECLTGADIAHTICVATEYGEVVLGEHPLVTVHQGRMNREEIEKFLSEGKYTVIIDATHPFAKDITHNIKAAVEKLQNQKTEVSYLRLNRDCVVQEQSEITNNISYFESNEACAKALASTKGNILLTTGSKELSVYCFSEDVKDRLYVRVLPRMESIALCMEQGICGKQIIAMQGPFTAEMNEAIIRQYEILHFVTKESGVSGGYQEKLKAIQNTGIRAYVIRRPKEEAGFSFSEICDRLEKIFEKKIQLQKQMEIILAGVGMGNENGLTKEVEKAIIEADILFGAKRLLKNMHLPVCPEQEQYPFYQAKQILPCLKKYRRKVVILFSGDSGFYSGTQSLYAALEKEIQEHRLEASLCVMPGISSVAYLASCVGESYHDAAIYSMHGKEIHNLANRIKYNAKTFLLMSGVEDMKRLGRLLAEADLAKCEVITGYQMSYQEQKIEVYTPSECCELEKEGLYTCLVKNPYALNRKLTPGIADEHFIRDKVPMTKEEVRMLSICKLQLQKNSVVYDIGSGTGSVAVEIAALSDDIQVYAVERKKEAVSLLQKNIGKSGLKNITVIEAAAPDGLSAPVMATHAFIGGSGGRLKEILAALQQINPAMRIVINAVSMETIGEIKDILSTWNVKEEEVVQIQISRVKTAGGYHMMQAQNPVWICSFAFA